MRACLMSGMFYNHQPWAPWQFGVIVSRFTFSSDLQVFCRRTALDTDFSGLEEKVARVRQVVCKDGLSRAPSLLRQQGHPLPSPWAAPLPTWLLQVLSVGCEGCFCYAGCLWGMFMGDVYGKSWSFHAEVAWLLFPKRSWGVFALSHLPSGLGLKNKIVERKNPDGDSAGLDVKISSPLWVGAHLYTWFMPVGMRETDLTNDRFWMVASNVINVCWLGALPNFELLSIVWGWTRAAWVLKYFHIK